MKYHVSINKNFWKSVKKLKHKYSDAEYVEIIDEIRESILLLADEGSLPPEYKDHVLRRSPYQEHNEYHLQEHNEYHLYDDNVLVIYVRSDKRLHLRFIEVTDHESLNKS